jgi:lipopolysaccharide transport system permease protein
MTQKDKIIIEPGRVEKNYWKDIWKYKELFYILSWRDVKVRYKQTIFGILWAFIRPFLTMIIFTFIFNKVAGLKSQVNTPYALVVFSALLPWQFFSTSLSSAGESLITNSNLLSKIYFPRIIVPASAIITNFIDLLISMIVLVIMMIYFHYLPSFNIIFLPFFILLSVFASFSFGVFISTLNVKYRDFRYVVPFIIQIGLYISPVGFSSSVVPEKWKYLYYLNPIVGIIDGFRWSIIKNSDINIFSPYILISISISIIFFFIGIKKFRSMEKTIADII